MAECSCHSGTPAVGTCQGCQLPYCGQCLLTTPDGRQLCRACARTGAGMIQKKQDPGGLAIASLALSALGFFFCITAIPGMVLGFIELSNIKKGQSPAEGKSLALAGAIIGTIISALLAISVIVFLIAIAIGVSTA